MMNSSSPVIQAKVSKVGTSLSDLKKELLKCTEYLYKVKQKSENMVENLNGISTPALYLNEFVPVNLFLSSYTNLIMEMNCKFEMMEIIESENGSSKRNKSCLNKVHQVFEQLLKTEINSSMDSLDFSESDGGFHSNLCSSFREKLQSSVLEEGKVLVAKKATDDQEVQSSSGSSALAKATVLRAGLNGSGEQAEVSVKKEVNEPAEKTSDKEDVAKEATNDQEARSSLDDSAVVRGADDSDRVGWQVGPEEFWKLFEDYRRRTLKRLSSSGDGISPFWNGYERPYYDGVNIIGFEPDEEEVDKITEIKPLVIPRVIGKAVKVNVKEVTSPSEFYVHILNENMSLYSELQQLLKLMTDQPPDPCFQRHINPDSKKTELNGKTGNYVLYFSRIYVKWYRALVKDWRLNQNDEMVLVNLLDEGGLEFVSVHNLKPMVKYLMKYPAFAQRCHLAGVCPVRITDKTALMWSIKARDEMMKFLRQAENCQILIAPNDPHLDDHDPSSLPVVLYVDDGRECLNRILLERMQAKLRIPSFDDPKRNGNKPVEKKGGKESSKTTNDGPKENVNKSSDEKKSRKASSNKKSNSNTNDGKNAGDDLKATEVDDSDDAWEDQEDVEEEDEEEAALKNWDPMKEDYESHFNSYDMNVSNPRRNFNDGGYDQNKFFRPFAKGGKGFRKKKFRKDNRIRPFSQFVSRREEVYRSAFNALPRPSINSIIRVLVTSVVDVNQFYCIPHHQMENPKEGLAKLVDCMNEDNNVTEMKKLLTPPAAGQIVIARYSQDQCWYRAKILESEPENDNYLLVFVDYGNKESLPLSDLRAIEPRYLHLPFQGMQCFIYGVGKNPEASQDEAMKYVADKLLDMDFKIEVISHFPGEDVSLLVKVFDPDGTDIGKDIIDHKYGLKREDILFSDNGDMLPG